MELFAGIGILMDSINDEIGPIPPGPAREKALSDLAKKRLQNKNLSTLEKSIYTNLIKK